MGPLDVFVGIIGTIAVLAFFGMLKLGYAPDLALDAAMGLLVAAQSPPQLPMLPPETKAWIMLSR